MTLMTQASSQSSDNRKWCAQIFGSFMWRHHLIPLLFVFLVSAVGCSGKQRTVEEVSLGPHGLSGGGRPPPPPKPEPEPLGGGTEAGATVDLSSPGKEVDAVDAGDSIRDTGRSHAGRATDGTAEVADTGQGRSGGASSPQPSVEPERSAPVLPGRAPAKPALSAAKAAESAKRLLKRAQQMRSVDASAAAELALKAYDQVFPHAEADAECKKICQQLEGMLEAAGQSRGQTDDVPTRFE